MPPQRKAIYIYACEWPADVSGIMPKPPGHVLDMLITFTVHRQYFSRSSPTALQHILTDTHTHEQLGLCYISFDPRSKFPASSWCTGNLRLDQVDMNM